MLPVPESLHRIQQYDQTKVPRVRAQAPRKQAPAEFYHVTDPNCVLGFPLSACSRVEKAQLLILQDESLTVAEAGQDFATTVGIAAAVLALLVGLVAVLTGASL